MNYLAHLHLAHVSETSYCGNLLGDFAKNLELSTLPKDIIVGIKNHQYVDALVDNHLASIAFRSQQTIGRRRFAGIVQDVLMDYWLVNKWSDFHTNSIHEFHEEFLPDLLNNHALCPPRLQTMIESLEKNYWLSDLGEFEGLKRALNSIIKRWKYGHYLQPFYDDLPILIATSEAIFDQVYPYLVDKMKL